MAKPAVNIKGLSNDAVLLSRQQHGNNALQTTEDRTFLHVLKDVALAPMFIILLAACTVYFFMHQYDAGIIMLLSIFFLSCLSFFQDY